VRAVGETVDDAALLGLRQFGVPVLADGAEFGQHAGVVTVNRAIHISMVQRLMI